VTAALALVLCFLLPGIAGGVLLSWWSPDPGRAGSLVMRGLSCGAAAWLISSGLLARTVGITRTSSWVVEALLALASVAVLAVPKSWRVLRSAGLEAGYLAAMVAVTWLAWLPVGLQTLRTTWAMAGSTPWYYWSLAQQVAHAGHVPATSVEWGTTLPFLDDYRLLSTGTAMLLTQGGANGIPVVNVVVVLTAALLGCGAALLANALGSGRLASLIAAAVVITTGIGAMRLTGYRAEGLGIGLSLLMVACFIDWFRRGERGSLVAGCLVGVALANVHGIALLASAAMLVAAGVATLTRRRLRQHVVRVVASGAILLVSLVVGGLALGAASGTKQVGKLGHLRGLADPTWDFVRAAQGHVASMPPTNHAVAEGALSRAFRDGAIWVFPALCIAVVGLALGLATKQAVARRTLVFSLVTLVGLAAIGATFALGWSSYVPRKTGSGRFVMEVTLLVAPVVACGFACLIRYLGRVAGLTWRRTVSVILVAAFCALGLRNSALHAEALSHAPPRKSDVSALRDVGVPAGSTVLTNAWTQGYIPQVMGARGLLDGRAPFTYPRVLKRANHLLRKARDFYQHPCRTIGFLDKHDVSYVIVVRRDSHALSSSNLVAKHVDASNLDACPELTRVTTTPNLTVFRVDR
jgi:hypothetical protein